MLHRQLASYSRVDMTVFREGEGGREGGREGRREGGGKERETYLVA